MGPPAARNSPRDVLFAQTVSVTGRESCVYTLSFGITRMLRRTSPLRRFQGLAECLDEFALLGKQADEFETMQKAHAVSDHGAHHEKL